VTFFPHVHKRRLCPANPPFLYSINRAVFSQNVQSAPRKTGKLLHIAFWHEGALYPLFLSWWNTQALLAAHPSKDKHSQHKDYPGPINTASCRDRHFSGTVLAFLVTVRNKIKKFMKKYILPVALAFALCSFYACDSKPGGENHDSNTEHHDDMHGGGNGTESSTTTSGAASDTSAATTTAGESGTGGGTTN
jgi:hypothetical protein